MRTWNRPALTMIAAVAVFTAGCSTDSKPSPVQIPATTTAMPVQPVPDSHKNKYVAGPFTITLVQGVAQEPRGVTGSEVLVENTSTDFTGMAHPEVQYFQGADVLGTNGGKTSMLAPGQRQTIWVDAFVNKNVTGQFVNAQLISVWFGADEAKPGTTLLLAH